MTINQFIKILKTLKQIRESGKYFAHDDLQKIIRSIVKNAELSQNSDNWIATTESTLSSWSSELVK